MKPKKGYNMKKRLFGKKTYILFGILCCVLVWLQCGIEGYAFTRTTGEVTGSSVKVRKEASTTSDMVAGVRAGDDVDVVDAVNGSDGKVWYKILVKADEYGYIRSDFVTLASGAQTPSEGTTTPTTPTTDADSEKDSEVTPVDAQKGHTSTNNVKVRKQASTTSAEVDRLNQSQIFTISGTATGPDGKTWYYVSYVDGGAAKSGFIRSDLVTIMEETVEETEPEEETEDSGETVLEGKEEDEEAKPNIPAPTTNYEAVYTTDENGNYIWYLYDRTAGQRYKVDQLLSVSKEKQEEIDNLSSANFGLKIGLIITMCLLVMVGVAIAFYILKMREEQEDSGNRKTVSNHNPLRNQGTVRNTSNVRPQTLTNQPKASSSQTRSSQQTTSNQKPVSQPVVQTKTAADVTVKETQAQKSKLAWKAKNFLEDNDDMEFGFLDFDEDDE